MVLFNPFYRQVPRKMGVRLVIPKVRFSEHTKFVYLEVL